MRLLHVSDPHVQLPDWRRRPWRALGPLRAIATFELWKGRGRLFDGAEESLAGFARLAAGYDHCILTGDLTQLGLPEEHALARAALGPLAGDPARLTVLPGNHDRYPWVGRAQRFYEEAFPEHLASDLDCGPVRVRLLAEVALVIADSSFAVSWPVITNGGLDAATLAGVKAALAAPEVRSRCALVITHHAPLLASGRAKRLRPHLAGHGEFLRACVEGGAQAVLCGHVHERYLVPATEEHPLVICCGSSTELGKRGGWELEIANGVLQMPRVLAG